MREGILTGSLKRGQRLVQTEVAASLGVSTTPVREALRELAAEGLVRVDAYRGAFIVGLDSADVRDVYRIRLVIEPLVMRQVTPRLSEQTIRSLRRLHDSMSDRIDPAQWLERNRDFHMGMYEKAAARRLTDLIGSLRDASIMHIANTIEEVEWSRERASRGHEEILRALEKRDLLAVGQAMTRHLQFAMSGGRLTMAPN